MSTAVETIKERLGIADVVGSYIKLEKAGINYKAKCPFHNEKTPSFFVSPARNSYFCFGCSSKGDIFSFVQEFEGLDFMGALRVLAMRAGVDLTPERPQAKTERERLYSVMDQAAQFFQQCLSENKEALLYLKRRGLKIETVRSWRIGYAPNEWRSLYDHLRAKGWGENEMEKAGLIKKADTESGGRTDARYYDRFRGRVMFPIFDSSGRVIAFSGRILDPKSEAAKYLNSPDTPLFNKSQVLYGLDQAKLEIRRNEFSLLVEGQMDLLMSHQAGHGNTVAVSGTALTPEHLSMLKRLSDKVVMAFDSDSAGFKAALRAAEIALGMGMEVRVVDIVGGKDPADLVLSNPDEWKRVIAEAKHVIDYHLGKLLASSKDPRDLARLIREQVLPYVASLESNMEKSHFISRIASMAKIREEAVWEDFRKTAPLKRTAEEVGKPVRPTRKESVENRILGILWWKGGGKENTFPVSDLKNELGQIIGKEELLKLESLPEEQKNELIFEAELVYAASEKLEEEVRELLWRSKEEKLKGEFVALMQELQEAERSKDVEKASKILKRCQELSQIIRELSGKK